MLGRLTILVTLCLAATCVCAQTAPEFEREIVRWEGRSRRLYLDSLSHPTIGIGHRIAAKDFSLAWVTADLSDDAIQLLYIRDYLAALEGAINEVPSFVTQPPVVRIMAVALVFNLGRAGFHEFHDFRAALEKHDYLAAANALDNSLWAAQLPDRAAAYTYTLRNLR